MIVYVCNDVCNELHVQVVYSEPKSNVIVINTHTTKKCNNYSVSIVSVDIFQLKIALLQLE